MTRGPWTLPTVVTVLALVTVVAPTAASAQQAPLDTAPVPERMAALGDSITRAFHTDCGLAQDCPAQSWATGSSDGVDSHAERLAALDPTMTQADNLAVTGATSADLPSQASRVAPGTAYVTVLIGANDACTDTTSQMTDTATFAANVGEAFDTLAALDPQPRVFVSSIPDLYQLWEVGRTSGSARFAWWLYGICQSMLEDPLSTADADVNRRQLVVDRVVDYNAALASACGGYGPLCRYDQGATYESSFTLAQLSPIDYFHPNTAGQATLAEVTWGAGFAWTAAGGQPPQPQPEPEPATFGVTLESSAEPAGRNRWTAVVTITASSDVPVEGAVVSGDWGASARGSGSCTTDVDGVCEVTKRVRGASATFTVTEAVADGVSWDGSALTTTVVAP